MTPAELKKKYTPDRMAAIRKQFDRDVDAWAAIKKEAEADMQCTETEQGPWPDAEWNARHAKGAERPCLHEDVLTQYVNQVTNKIEANPMGPEVTPAGEGADEKSAEFIENRLRAIDYDNNARYAYEMAAHNAAQRSYGGWKLETARSGKFSQKVCIESIMDPDSIVPGFAKKPDWSDLQDCWEIERITHEKFRENYGNKAKLTDFEGMREVAPKWADDRTVQVAAWWHFDTDEKELLRLDTPEGDMDVFAEEFDGVKDIPASKVIDRRPLQQKKVLKTVLTAVEVLDETEWIDPGVVEDGVQVEPPEIPIFFVTGRVKYVRNERKIDSLVRKARVGQLLYDYTISAIQEAIGMTPKVKAWGPEGTFDTSTNWARLSRDPAAYAEWKPVTNPESGETLPPPEFITYEPPIDKLELAKQSILIGIQNAIGMSSTERKDRAAKSGKALDQLTQEMEVGTAHYFASLRMQQDREYRILARILPLLEKDQKQVALRNKFGKTEMAPVNPNYYGAPHSVAVGTGKLYQTLQDKQEEAAQDLMKIGDPNVLLAVLPGALRMRGLGDFGEQIADLVESIQPPPMQAAREQGGDIPPQVRQAMQQAQQAVQALNAHAKELEKRIIELEDERQAKILELQSKERISQDDNRTKIAVAEINASVKEDINALNQQVAAMKHVADVLTERFGIAQSADQANQDRSMTAQEGEANRQHEAGQAGLERQHTAQQAGMDRQQATQEGEANREQERALAVTHRFNPESETVEPVGASAGPSA